MIPLLFSKSVYLRRRKQLLSRLSPDTDLIVLFNAPLKYRNYDSEYNYRPDSSFYYLCGYAEQGSALLLWKEKNQANFELFTLPRDITQEQWTGFRYGPERAKELTGADRAYPAKDLGGRIVHWLNTRAKGQSPRIWSNIGEHPEHKIYLERVLEDFAPRHRAGMMALESLGSISHEIRKLRLIKDEADLKVLRKSSAINVQAHLALLKALKPGLMEYQAQAILEYEYKNAGCESTAYGSICAGGSNAVILHYHENNAKLRSGDMFLIDAGCEYRCYASDITRTYPVNGRFTKEQRTVMGIVEKAHRAALEVSRVGTPYERIHEASVQATVEGLLEAKIIKGREKEIIKKLTYKKYFPHGTGHWLGLDVHDPCPYYDEKGQSLKLREGMVFTIEPGLYFLPDDTSVAPRYRGLGVRIEDDVVITKGEPEVLTEGLVRYADEIEDFMANR